MQEVMLVFLRCPVCRESLQVHIISTFEKKFKTGSKTIVKSGVLICSCDFLFPIIDSVPRMLIESFMEHEDFLQKHVTGFFRIKANLLNKYKDLIQSAENRNKKTKSSFSFEWNLLKGEKQNIWRLNKEEYKTQLFNELDLPEPSLQDKLAIDVGCGHGRSAILLSDVCGIVIGMDLGLSVIKACGDNVAENCHFIQADLHQPPFANHIFDIVYSSGVLHHTPDTKNAFRIVSQLVKRGGVYCVWLYKPYNNRLHKSVIDFRKITTHLPLRFQFWLYRIFLVPVHKFISWLRHRKPKSWREIMIELFDSFTPVYRFEHQPEEVEVWFSENEFIDIKITTINNIGFSMKGCRRLK